MNYQTNLPQKRRKMSNYWIYTVSVTDMRNGNTETTPYFNRRVATSAFRELCEQFGYDWNNVITRYNDELLIAKAGGWSYEFEIKLTETQIIQVIND